MEQGAKLAEREEGLHHSLSSRQVAMIGLGSTIGTGLFLGSALSVQLAGPAVILSFAGGALIALTVMWALAELSVAHPAPGSFGLYAEMFLHPWAGFAVRYTYWFTLVIIIGSEVVAAAIYCKLWFPGVPSWLWVAGFSLAILYVNTISVKNFGTFEYWFAMIKVVTVVVFLILATALLCGLGFPRIGTANYTAYGGFLPNGWNGVGLGVAMAVFSFLGLEIVGTTAGEAANPQATVPRALRRTLLVLAIFYLGGLALVVGIVPWKQIGIGESPFVRVFQNVGIPAAGHVMNFVVLTAALSSAMCNLYFTARMLFSLSRGGYAPVFLGRLSKRGMPVFSVLASGMGLVAALLLSHFYEKSAFVFMIGVAFFGGPFAWLITLLTHLAFRRHAKRTGTPFLSFAPKGPWSSLLGAIAILGVLVSTWWIPGFRITLRAGPLWLVFLTLCYFVWRRFQSTGKGIASND
ncbi:MAG TPA: amino acid permease [Candidatus Acidoferrum sp.]|nr:amino acid permease [Candidatus Acidoferrum sp.]